MGRRPSPGEKRLKGLLSGDPARVVRSIYRSVWTADPEIYATISKSGDAVIAAIGGIEIADPVAANKRDQLVARLTGGALSGGAPGECHCAKRIPTGDPRDDCVMQVQNTRHLAGHTEYTVGCQGCARRYTVTEDPSYHTPQYRWS